MVCCRGTIYRTPGGKPRRERRRYDDCLTGFGMTLADVTRERIEAAILLYKQGKIRRIFVSGDNRHNRETDNIAAYAVQRGVSANDVISDPIGIDTGDTCRHFRLIAPRAILLTQRFHLARALLMCEQNGIQVMGLAVDELGLLESRGDNAFERGLPASSENRCLRTFIC
jgi:vancomycin permeability regulator SanA